MKTYVATFTRRFCAAHRLKDDEGVCSRIHGHNYEAVIHVVTQRLNSLGMVVHADVIKAVVDNQFDHKLILEYGDPLRVALVDQEMDGWIVTTATGSPPTTENLALRIAEDVALCIHKEQGHGYVEVDLRETPTIKARARVEW